MSEQTRYHPRAPEIYIFDQQVRRDDQLAPGALTNHRRQFIEFALFLEAEFLCLDGVRLMLIDENPGE